METTSFTCTVYTFGPDGFTPSVKLAEWIRFQPRVKTFQQFAEDTRRVAQAEFPDKALFIRYERVEVFPAPSK
jgi:hypothetical protein